MVGDPLDLVDRGHLAGRGGDRGEDQRGPQPAGERPLGRGVDRLVGGRGRPADVTRPLPAVPPPDRADAPGVGMPARRDRCRIRGHGHDRRNRRRPAPTARARPPRVRASARPRSGRTHPPRAPATPMIRIHPARPRRRRPGACRAPRRNRRNSAASRCPTGPGTTRARVSIPSLWGPLVPCHARGDGPGARDRAVRTPVKRSELPTPALVVDGPALERNLATMAAARPGAACRPHVKAHKTTALAQRQRGRRAPGVHRCDRHARCSDSRPPGLGEDLLLANETVDPARLRALADCDARVTVAVDSAATVDAAAANGIREVLVDVDVGLPRCGCAPADAGALADLARARASPCAASWATRATCTCTPTAPSAAAATASAMDAARGRARRGRRRRDLRRARPAPTTSTRSRPRSRPAPTR